MKWAWPAAALALFVSCGRSELAGPCQSTCDCTRADAPLKCPGEWVCNAEKTCEYTCQPTCSLGGVYTCPSSEECNGSICSERKACN